MKTTEKRGDAPVRPKAEFKYDPYALSDRQTAITQAEEAIEVAAMAHDLKSLFDRYVETLTMLGARTHLATEALRAMREATVYLDALRARLGKEVNANLREIFGVDLK